MSIIIYEDAIRRIDVSDHLNDVGQEVGDFAYDFANQPVNLYKYERNFSQHPGQRSGDLLASIHHVLGADAEGMYVDVGSDATHRGFSYPFWLEENGFSYLTAALESLSLLRRETG